MSWMAVLSASYTFEPPCEAISPQGSIRQPASGALSCSLRPHGMFSRRALLYHGLADPRACHGGVARLDADNEGELIAHGTSQDGFGAGPQSSARPSRGPGEPMETWSGTAWSG